MSLLNWTYNKCTLWINVKFLKFVYYGIIFNAFGYILSDEDKKAIELRNYSFHGNLSHILKESTEPEWGVYAVALRLHKLCCVLLLKAAGYKGSILNNEVILGVKEACERKEPPYLYI